MEHTPLPWGNMGGLWIAGADGGMVADCVTELTRSRGLEKNEANAHAELLAALRLCVKLDNDRRAGCEIIPADWAECNQTVQAAIAKAKRI